jgi:hypothetical protein
MKNGLRELPRSGYLAIGAIIGFIVALVLQGQPKEEVTADSHLYNISGSTMMDGSGATPGKIKPGVYKVRDVDIWNDDDTGKPTFTFTMDSVGGTNSYVIAGPSRFHYSGAAIMPNKLVGITNDTIFCYTGDPQEGVPKNRAETL